MKFVEYDGRIRWTFKDGERIYWTIVAGLYEASPDPLSPKSFDKWWCTIHNSPTDYPDGSGDSLYENWLWVQPGQKPDAEDAFLDYLSYLQRVLVGFTKYGEGIPSYT